MTLMIWPRTIAARKGADADTLDAKLAAKGPAKCARKIRENQSKAIIEAVRGDKAAADVPEAAEPLYHLLVKCDLPANGPCPTY